MYDLCESTRPHWPCEVHPGCSAPYPALQWLNPGSSKITHEPLSSSFTRRFSDGLSVVTLISLPARTLISPLARPSTLLPQIGFLVLQVAESLIKSLCGFFQVLFW